MHGGGGGEKEGFCAWPSIDRSGAADENLAVSVRNVNACLLGEVASLVVAGIKFFNDPGGVSFRIPKLLASEEGTGIKANELRPLDADWE